MLLFLSERLLKWRQHLFSIGIFMIALGILLLFFFWSEQNLFWRRTREIESVTMPMETTTSAIIRVEKGQTDYLLVDIAGAVKRPGIYRLHPNARMNELLLAAGGFKANEVDKIYVQQKLNLAQKVVDGQKYYIPYFAERINQAITLPTAAEARTLTDHQDINSLNVSASPTKRTQLVSLNHADASSLQTLPGIGVVRAEKIIAHRPYASLDELLSKKVLSKKQLTNIESLVSL